MSLVRHIRQQDWSGLEEAWTELILDTGEIAPALEAVALLARRKLIPRCLPLVREHAELLVDAERPKEAAELLGTAMLLGGSPGELARPLFLAAEAAWGAEEIWDIFVEIAGLRENVQDMRKAWRSFRKLLAIEPGRVVYHAKGWGLGVIGEIDLADRVAAVQFSTGRRDRFPFSTAIEIFEILEEDDLRNLVAKDPEELGRRLKKQPLDVLRWILRRNGGKANHAGIKLAMGTLGVEGGAFTAWWRRARKAAETSEWFEISGPAARASVRMLDQATDPAESIRHQLKRTGDLGQALARVRLLLSGGKLPEDVRNAALDTLAELSRDESMPRPDRLACWLFLREQWRTTPPALHALLQNAAADPAPVDPSQPPALWSLFQLVPGVRDQERCIELLQEIHGPDAWLDAAAPHLHHAAPGMARGIIEALDRAGRHEELITHYTTLLTRPARNPTVVVRLGECIETGEWEDRLPPRLQRAQCLLQLGVYLMRKSVANVTLTRARGRLSVLLTEGRPPLLARLLQDTTIDDLRTLAILVDSGVDGPIDRVFTRIAVEVSPDVFRDDDRPFWVTGGVWTTRAGLAGREEELRVLRDIKIPENAEAIGKAASYGDLSENSEWEAAIEEQRHLTSRAMEIENDVRDAQLLEDAPIPENTVVPGTAVRFRDLRRGGERRVRILGPWDSTDEDVISYRSPLATAMLGRQIGETLRFELPSGAEEIEILGVEILPL